MNPTKHCYLDDTSPAYSDFLNAGTLLIKDEKIEKIFDELKGDLNNSLYLIKNADVIFTCSSTHLYRTTWLCAGAALLAVVGRARRCPMSTRV